MQASANTPSLATVIKEYESIKVDDYQRTYSWGRDEISELFEDLKDCALTGEVHFFGTLIFQAKLDSLESTIVDGQQRLTTVFVLMNALKDEVARLGIDTLPKDEAAGRKLPVAVINKIWDFIYVDADDERPRFHSNRFLTAIFEKCVYPDVTKQAKIAERDTNLGALTLQFRKAVKIIRDLIRDDLDKFETSLEKLERINRFVEALTSRFLVLRVTTSNISESLEIFLTLNNRGLPLGASDLVRGDIIAKIGDGESELNQGKLHRTIFEEWSDIADAVKDVESFLRHWLVATSEDKVQKKKVFDFVSKRLKGGTPEERKEKATRLWGDLKAAAEVYKLTIQPVMGGTAQYNLQLLNGYWKSHRVLMLSVLGSNISDALRDQVIRQTLVLCFRWNMAGENAQILENTFQQLGNEFRESNDAAKLISGLKSAAAKLSTAKIELYLKESIDEGYIGRAILFSLNRARAAKQKYIDLNADLHLEHIAPQTATEGWKADLFNGNESLYPLYDDLTSQIGNLTLLDHRINMSVKQLPFRNPLDPDKSKSKEYKDSVIMMTDDLLFLNKWDQVEIETRTSYMIDAFNHVFSIDPSGETLMTYQEWKNLQK